MKCSEPFIILMSAAALLLCSLMLHGCENDKDKNFRLDHDCTVCEVWELGKCKVRKETSCEDCEDLGITDQSTCDTACKQKNVNASHGTEKDSDGNIPRAGGSWEQGCMTPDGGGGCMILCKCHTGGVCESSPDAAHDQSCEEHICAPHTCMGTCQ
eukprot:gnl/TRDRNA2_/TRDRNA2_173007_c0_seq2.p1 gnl/TRDRNA2_/TRDRNA2_173007_c0~~gnl/TRDRNA2_/TRDRNA2_173007_c0_seq2.p1  ORF type:complete len:178 (-),score=17.51 gnl/TRDRNA2_/TRDRNA2_173007_c0_seq2:210-677(-)